jgi:hypothetical protein
LDDRNVIKTAGRDPENETGRQNHGMKRQLPAVAAAQRFNNIQA